jgi:hypothetical protein
MSRRYALGLGAFSLAFTMSLLGAGSVRARTPPVENEHTLDDHGSAQKLDEPSASSQHLRARSDEASAAHSFELPRRALSRILLVNVDPDSDVGAVRAVTGHLAVRAIERGMASQRVAVGRCYRRTRPRPVVAELTINAYGRITGATIVPAPTRAQDHLARCLRRALHKVRFPRALGQTTFQIPLRRAPN